MKEKKLNNKYPGLTDEELFKYILGSLEYVEYYLKYYTLEQFETELKIQDAVCYRMHCVGMAASELSEKILNKYSDFPWILYTTWTLENDPDIIWELAKEKYREDFGSISSLFSKLEEIYFMEFIPSKITSKNNNNNRISQSTDYEFTIKSNKSIWTVKKK